MTTKKVKDLALGAIVIIQGEVYSQSGLAIYGEAEFIGLDDGDEIGWFACIFEDDSIEEFMMSGMNEVVLKDERIK